MFGCIYGKPLPLSDIVSGPRVKGLAVTPFIICAISETLLHSLGVQCSFLSLCGKTVFLIIYIRKMGVLTPPNVPLPLR